MSWFSNVWLGIVLLTLIFIYSSIGSAVPQVRQHRLLEMTEFEWFQWWPFDVLIGLFCTNLAVVTVRRIPLRLINTGVWMIHCGILILCAGSVYYFATKVEGDMPVFRRHVAITVPGAKQPLHLLVRPDNAVSALGVGGNYRFQVADIQPDGPIPSEADAGRKAYSVSVMVTTPRQQFVRRLLADHPQFTEDVIPGTGRAVKQAERKLLDETIVMTLEYEPQSRFYVRGSSALYFRTQGTQRWTERPIHGLPRYHERISEAGQVWPGPSPPVRLRGIDLDVPQVDDDPLQDVSVRVVGFLRYAIEKTRWAPGGDALNPVLGLACRHGDDEPLIYTLAALLPTARDAADGEIAFRWVDSPAELEAVVGAAEPYIRIEIPERDIVLEVPVSAAELGQDDGPFREIDGSDYAFRINGVADRLPMSDGQAVSVAIVEIRSPTRRFRRMVADDARWTRDMNSGDAPDDRQAHEPDAGIVMTYHPARARTITVVAGPQPIPLTLLVNTGTGTRRVRATVGEPVAFPGGLEVTVQSFYERARRQVKPQIVPLAQRDRNAGRANSMIQVSLSAANWEHRAWLPFNDYALTDDQYAVFGRVKHETRSIDLADGSAIELMFSRESRPLHGRVALDTFELETHPGGYTGAPITIEDFISRLRFEDADAPSGWGERVTVSSNHPAAHGDLWYFQASWDPPSRHSPGMNYTGLGVGNREGVFIQLAGTIIAIMGMIFVFYIKPLILRQRRVALHARLDA